MSKRSLESLIPDPNNARTHSDRNVDVVESSLGAVGGGRSIVVDENGVILAGNATVEAARRRGMKLKVVKGDRDTLIAVERDDLNEAEKVQLALADNRTAELAVWDYKVLSEQLVVLDSEMGVDLKTIGWDEVEAANLLAADWTPPPAGELPAGAGGKSSGHAVVFSGDQWAEVNTLIERYKETLGEDEAPSEAEMVLALMRAGSRPSG